MSSRLTEEEADATHASGSLSRVIRWMLFLPAAILAALSAFWLVFVLNHVTVFMVTYEPVGGFLSFVIRMGARIVCGAVFIYVAGYVAPAYENRVAVTLAGLAVLFAGGSILSAFLIDDWTSILEITLVAGGACAAAHDIVSGRAPLISGRTK